MQCWHIHIEGQVQGVGFRPFVYRLAKAHALNGWVNNTSDGVHIECQANKGSFQLFCEALVEQAPPLSRITHFHTHEIAEQAFTDFQIIHSDKHTDARLLLTPDFGMCRPCREELKEATNRRQTYPFITCTNCGPRYSIIQKLPYDRPHTSMAPFQMCKSCEQEYHDPLDRRYFSQTNSCPTCSIELRLYDQQKNFLSKEVSVIIEQVAQAWEDGKIVAIKGIGGYLICCDASQKKAVQQLRRRKHRPSKPFALMFPSVGAIDEEMPLQDDERKLLQSSVAPIVLLDWPNKTTSTLASEDIAPGLEQLGVMIPYTPLYELLLQRFGKPIVATSGNISQSPIVFQDDKALEELSTIADLILVNNRAIQLPQDDSVYKFSSERRQAIVLRRSRGLAPTFIQEKIQWPEASILACGAQLKSTFSLLQKGNTYISQYLGDLDQFDTQESYRHCVQHFLELFKVQPSCILTDSHPAYASTQYGHALAEELQVPVTEIQHHQAHFAALLGEHNLVRSKVPVLGVIWDGTGWGTDRQIWGGEFFSYENFEFHRAYHFDYFKAILGDKMPKEARIAALSACHGLVEAAQWLRPKFSSSEWQIYGRLLDRKNQLQTSSVGRLFDAVASLLGLMDVQTFEGEAAMRLESLARKYTRKNGLNFSENYATQMVFNNRISTQSLMQQLLLDLQNEKPIAFIAAKFHFSLVQLIRIIAQSKGIKHLAFSGGVFQNSLLVDLIGHHLHKDFQLYFHKQLSPNDENISFGQLVHYQIQQLKFSMTQSKSNTYVFSNTR